MYNGVYTVEQFAYTNDTLAKWLTSKINGTGIGENLLNLGIRKLAIYGISGLGHLAYQDIKNAGVPVFCFIDRNVQWYQDGYDGLEVLGLEQLGRLGSDCYILVTPEYYFYEILKDLLERGIPLERIISLAMVV